MVFNTSEFSFCLRLTVQGRLTWQLQWPLTLQAHLPPALLLMSAIFRVPPNPGLLLGLHEVSAADWEKKRKCRRENESLESVQFMHPSLYIYMSACSVMSDSAALETLPQVCSPPGSSVHGRFSRQEYQSGLPFPTTGSLPDPGVLQRH